MQRTPIAPKSTNAERGKPFRVGRAVLPWRAENDGWALPGGDVVSNPRRAFEEAQLINRLIILKPGLYSARAANLSTNEQVAA